MNGHVTIDATSKIQKICSLVFVLIISPLAIYLLPVALIMIIHDGVTGAIFILPFLFVMWAIVFTLSKTFTKYNIKGKEVEIKKIFFPSRKIIFNQISSIKKENHIVYSRGLKAIEYDIIIELKEKKNIKLRFYIENNRDWFFNKIKSIK